MNELIDRELNIENLIYEIRGKQVMLDRDLASLYQVETRVLIQSVKRNINRFPEEFFFQMNYEEFNNWRSQFVISDRDKIGLRRPPYVFTEQGVAMLSAVLKSDIAINVSINIMNAFINMRKYISNELVNANLISNKLLEHDKRINALEETFSKFKENTNEIFFEGQIYDAYSKIVDILGKAKKQIIIIDGYADKNILDIISKLKVKVILVCKTRTLLSKIDIDKYNKQYNNLKVIYNDSYHDRFYILDDEIIYHCGTSVNYAGSKTFAINRIEDQNIITKLINDIDDIIKN